MLYSVISEVRHFREYLLNYDEMAFHSLVDARLSICRSSQFQVSEVLLSYLRFQSSHFLQDGIWLFQNFGKSEYHTREMA